MIHPAPDDPSSSYLYSYGQIDPFGWLPDWFVSSFAPEALKSLISKVTKSCLAEQERRYGKGVLPDYTEANREEFGNGGKAIDVKGGEGEGGSLRVGASTAR